MADRPRLGSARRALGPGPAASALAALLAIAAPRARAEDPPAPAPDAAPAAEAGAQAASTSPDAAAAQPVLVPPELLEFVEAELPPGTTVPDETVVAVSIEVLADGAVGAVEVVTSGGAAPDAAALAAARRMRFLPATWGGAPVPVKIKFNYRFVTMTAPPHGPAGAAAEPPVEAPAEVNLAGRAIQRGTRRRLPSVAVAVARRDPGGGAAAAAAAETETDADGAFALTVPPGEYLVRFFDPAHHAAEIDAVVRAGERTDATVYLMPRSSDPYRTVVRTDRPRREVTRTILEAKEVTRVAGTFGEPFRVIEALPGLMRTPFTGGFLVVRGANPRDTGVYLDGHEIPLLYHFVVGSAVFNSDLVRSIEFSPGNWSVRHGRRLGGLVEVRTADDPPERLRGSVDLDLIDVGGLVSTPLSAAAAPGGATAGDGYAAVRRSHLDVVVNAVTDVGVAPRYWDYQLGAGRRLPGDWRGRVLLYGSDDAFDIVGDLGGESGPSDSGETTLGIAFHRLLARAFRPLPGGRLDVSALVGLDLIGFEFGPDTFETTGLNLEARADGRWEAAEALNLEAGLDVVSRRSSIRADTPDFPAPWWFPHVAGDRHGGESDDVRLRTDTDFDQLMPAAYVAADWELLHGLHLIPGLRADVFAGEALRDLTLDPRLVARAELPAEVVLKGGVGLFHQPPEPFQVAQDVGNTALSVPQALHLSAGAEVTIAHRLEVDVTGFHIGRTNLISLSRTVTPSETGAGVRIERFDDTREERAYGLELLVRHRPVGPFFGWIAYTLSRTERRESDTLPWIRHPLDQPHVLTLVASYDLGGGWEIGARARLVSGNPVTPVTGCVDDLDTDQCEAVRGAPRSGRLPAFFQVDARVDRRWAFDTWVLSAYLDLLNVTNQENSEFLQYDHRYRDRRFVPGVPILPSFGVKGEL